MEKTSLDSTKISKKEGNFNKLPSNRSSKKKLITRLSKIKYEEKEIVPYVELC
jgi:hypothetical protein